MQIFSIGAHQVTVFLNKFLNFKSFLKLKSRLALLVMKSVLKSIIMAAIMLKTALKLMPFYVNMVNLRNNAIFIERNQLKLVIFLEP